ncbi:HlyD family efflux transporter periplasmic adaptor subunit [Devosia sp. XK-2]|uniref:HlyD family secretion protein n=1 Tax=Devosia sp. XK-2 TaxID=3126689 RepID=UPI0030D23167
MNEFLAGLMAAILSLLPHQEDPIGYNGYLEADYVYVAPVSAGRIDAVMAMEGQKLAPGEVVFTLDKTQQQNLFNAAQARVSAARATLANLETGGRSEELDVIRASLAKAEADLAQAQSNLARSERLAEAGTVPAVRVEQDRTALASAKAQADQLRAQLAVAELPARNAQQVAAEANLNAAEADAERARQDLEDREVSAPVGGTVDKVFYRVGEVAGVGSPVVSILPDGPLEAWFFIPEGQRAAFGVGQAVTVTCDGCAAQQASIVHIASEPQTTPPIIYSREERSRLVYLVKARLADVSDLRPGQPVTVLP